MFNNYSIGMYEKALPDDLTLEQRLTSAKQIGYDFMELSVDQSSQRISRLDWDERTCRDVSALQQEIGVGMPTMCLSGLRSCPLGSTDRELREEGLDMLIRAVLLASRLGVRIVQVAGYDELMDKPSTEASREYFIRNLAQGLTYASKLGVTLAIENMDVDFTGSLERCMEFVKLFQNPYLQVYADVGNLSAMNRDLAREFSLAAGHISAIHIKDTQEGVFRCVPFGSGRVDFHEVFSLISSTGYRGLLLLEMWHNASSDAAAEAKRSFQYITGIMTEAGLK